jgi:hypothetical protein
MTDHRRRENREVSGDLSRKLSSNGKRNRSSPWRRGPLVRKAQNHRRFEGWQE